MSAKKNNLRILIPNKDLIASIIVLIFSRPLFRERHVFGAIFGAENRCRGNRKPRFARANPAIIIIRWSNYHKKGSNFTQCSFRWLRPDRRPSPPPPWGALYTLSTTPEEFFSSMKNRIFVSFSQWKSEPSRGTIHWESREERTWWIFFIAMGK